MAEVAAHVTDQVLPHLPVRQWVLSVPKRLRPFLVSYETIRQWCREWTCGGFAILSRLWLGPEYARSLKRRQGRLGDIWYLDEVFVKISGKRHYL